MLMDISLDFCLGFHRNLRVRTRIEHLQLERLYILGQIYNAILGVLFNFTAPPTILNCGIAIVFAWYVTMRHTELPLYIYWMFPYIAIVYGLIMFGWCFDEMLVIRASEDSLSKLRSRQKK